MRKFLFLLFLITFWGLRLSANEPPATLFSYVKFGDDTGFDLHVIDVETGEEVYSVITADYDCPLNISPDGRWLMFSQGSSSPQDHETYLVDLTTGEEYPFLPSRINAAWTSDSSMFAYKHENSLYVFDMETHFLHGLGQHYSTVAYQWVSDELFFVVDKQNELEIHKWNGTERFILNVIRRPLGDVSATISPDGRFIQTVVITTNDEGDWIRSYSVTSIETGKDVLNELAMNRFVAWLPDSSGFTYIDDEGGISLYDLSDNTTQQLVENRYFSPQYPLSSAFSSLMWSSTGRYLAYRQYYAGGTNPESYALSVLDMETGERHSIMGMVSTWAGQIHWVSSTQLVYTYADAKAGFPPPREQNNLWLYDVETGENTQLTDTPELNEQFNCAWG